MLETRDFVLCPGCATPKPRGQFAQLVARGDKINQCGDCAAFMEKLHGISIQPVPWGLREARREGWTAK